MKVEIWGQEMGITTVVDGYGFSVEAWRDAAGKTMFFLYCKYLDLYSSVKKGIVAFGDLNDLEALLDQKDSLEAEAKAEVL